MPWASSAAKFSARSFLKRDPRFIARNSARDILTPRNGVLSFVFSEFDLDADRGRWLPFGPFSFFHPRFLRMNSFSLAKVMQLITSPAVAHAR
jgi:hypothetical protein